MKDYVSRRNKTEHKSNLKKAYLYILLSILSVVSIIYFGIPLVVKYLGIFLDLKKSSSDVEITDTTPPPPPSFDEFPEYTNRKDVDLNGRTEPGANVKLLINNKTIDLISDSDGKFSYSFSLLSDETNIRAFSVDTAGNESIKTEAGTIIYDTEDPELSINNPSDGSEFFGSLSRQITIEGVTEKNANVIINSRHVIVDSDGEFSYSITLDDGENKFNITSEDQAGNKSEMSVTYFYTP